MRTARSKVYFVKPSDTPLADPNPVLMVAFREKLLSREGFVESKEPGAADHLVVNEPSFFKEWRYIKRLMSDPLIGRFPHKTFTLSTDDSATGLLPGLYVALQANRFSKAIHRAVPYPELANPMVAKAIPQKGIEKKYLAGWRGNMKSNPRLRKGLIRHFGGNPRFCIETSGNWFNHTADEHRRYVELVQNSQFSLCPAGWAATTFRIFDSMALGVCPVILADLWEQPKGPKWEEFCIFVPEKRFRQLETILNDHLGEAAERGQRAYVVWQEFFAGGRMLDYYADAFSSLVATMPATTPEREFRRWKSHTMYWSNGWTLPQRLARRAKRLLRIP
jgi:Exostosin family